VKSSRRVGSALVAALCFALLYLPMIAVAALSLNASRYGVAWGGFTLQWYARLAANRTVLQAAANTLVLAGVSTATATVLGTALALGLDRFPWPKRLKGTVDALVYVPVVIPDIVFAVGMLLAFEAARGLFAGLRLGMFTMVVAHITFETPFIALVVSSRLYTIGRGVEEAARDLYARTPYTLRRVTLPLVAPGIVAGAMLAFTLSLDDFVISFFTSGPASVTLPLYIYGALRRGISPEIHALSTIIFGLTVVLVLGLELVLRRQKEEQP
jgi:spermidine/putrescine transport system permease protein